VVPVASVRAQNDGLHLRVLNSLGMPTHVTVESTSTSWSSGEMPVVGPSKEFIQPVPPGQLEIGCEINGAYEARRVDLVDPQRYYTEPELACDTRDPALRDLPVQPPTAILVSAVREGLGDRMLETDTVGPVKGYESQTLNEVTEDPTAAVWRHGDMIAFVHVRGADGSASLPYTTLTLVEACAGALTAPTTTSSTAPTSPTSTPAT